MAKFRSVFDMIIDDTFGPTIDRPPASGGPMIQPTRPTSGERSSGGSTFDEGIGGDDTDGDEIPVGLPGEDPIVNPPGGGHANPTGRDLPGLDLDDIKSKIERAGRLRVFDSGVAAPSVYDTYQVSESLKRTMPRVLGMDVRAGDLQNLTSDELATLAQAVAGHASDAKNYRLPDDPGYFAGVNTQGRAMNQIDQARRGSLALGYGDAVREGLAQQPWWMSMAGG